MPFTNAPDVYNQPIPKFTTFLAEPVAIIKRLKDVQTGEGQTAEFVCELTKPDYKVTWMQSDVVITLDDKRFKQETDGSTYKLVIPDATPDMIAEYTIVAGENKSTANLNVKGISLTPVTMSSLVSPNGHLLQLLVGVMWTISYTLFLTV